jgi:hypothetical protein
MPNALPLSEHLYFHPKLQPCHAENFSLYRISPFWGKKIEKKILSQMPFLKKKYPKREK